MKKFQVIGYSYVDEKGRVFQNGSVVTVNEHSAYVKQQLYKLRPVEDVKMSKTTVQDLMVMKDIPSIRDRVATMAKQTRQKTHS